MVHFSTATRYTFTPPFTLFGEDEPSFDSSPQQQTITHQVITPPTIISSSGQKSTFPSLERLKSQNVRKKKTRAVQNALRIMKAQLQHIPPHLFRSEAAKKAGVKAGASVFNAEKAGIEEEIVRRHAFARAKTEISSWEILDRGYDELSMPRIKSIGKGAYPHQFAVSRIAYQHELQGDLAEIEHRRKTGKLVDLCVRQANRTLYYEICASWPVVDKEISNLRLDTEGDTLPDRIIFAVTQRKMRKPLEQAIACYVTSSQLSIPVNVVLAGDLIDIIENPK